MQAYIDDSKDDSRVLVYGGLIASADQWDRFSKAWRQCLDDAPWDVFKMKEVSHRCRGKRLEHAIQHYRAMCAHVLGGVCFVVPMEPLKKWAAHYGLAGTPVAKPYFWAPKGIINGLAQHQRQWGLSEPVDFIFDKRPEEEENTIRGVWESYLASIPHQERSVTGALPTFADDVDTLPLQAADMWAWSCRRTWLENDGVIPEDSYPVGWGKIGDIPQMILQWTEEDIVAELSRVSEMLDAQGQRDGI